MTPAAAETEDLSPDELREAWPALSAEERAEGLRLLPRDTAEDLFFSLGAGEQVDVIFALPPPEQRSWVRGLAPDDAADLVQEAPTDQRDRLLSMLDEQTRKEVQALLAYREDHAGGLMNPRFARLRADMTVDEAVTYLRRQTRQSVEMTYYAYVLDPSQHLLGVVSFRELMAARGDLRVSEVMKTEVQSVDEDADQEVVARLFRSTGLMAIPVVDGERRMKGVVTVDDIVKVVSEEATEDIQKLGGSESLGEPYLTIALNRMIKKRAGWLAALFLGEMLTATAMGVFEKEIDRAVVLALFVPLIISSGGNSGSQATSLVIRAMALGELRLRDWFRVIRRELGAGLALGSILGAIGLTRILLWQVFFNTYGEHYMLVGLTVALSLVGVVTFGTLAGSLLPFLLRRLGFDPASASAPFVATLVDVTGLIIYFTTASAILRGTLL
ncbi:MAG TPA: magnesium transporter [Myxococcales bacterium]|nr:magnesium transporter [Myxococcales bacterium]